MTYEQISIHTHKSSADDGIHTTFILKNGSAAFRCVTMMLQDGDSIVEIFGEDIYGDSQILYVGIKDIIAIVGHNEAKCKK